MNRDWLNSASDEFQAGFARAEIVTLRQPRSFVGPWFLGFLVGMTFAFTLPAGNGSSWPLWIAFALSGFGFWWDHRERQREIMLLEAKFQKRWPDMQ